MKRKITIAGWGLWCAALVFSGCHFSGKQKQLSEQSVAHSGNKAPEKQKQKKQPVDTDTPVATYRANDEDEVTNNDFVVEAFPTDDPKTFRLVIQFGANRASDKVEFPEPQYYKAVALRKGEAPNTCLLGFTDEEGKFNEMTAITGSTTKIAIKTLKAYYFKTETR